MIIVQKNSMIQVALRERASMDCLKSDKKFFDHFMFYGVFFFTVKSNITYYILRTNRKFRLRFTDCRGLYI